MRFAYKQYATMFGLALTFPFGQRYWHWYSKNMSSIMQKTETGQLFRKDESATQMALFHRLKQQSPLRGYL